MLLDRGSPFRREGVLRSRRGSRGALAPPPEEAQALKEFYDTEVRPYLFDKTGRSTTLSTRAKGSVVFAQLRTRVPASLHSVVDELEAICEERRQLRVQTRLHYWLHAWLLVHVPLSIALLVLSFAHAVIALRY